MPAQQQWTREWCGNMSFGTGLRSTAGSELREHTARPHAGIEFIREDERRSGASAAW